MTLISLPDALLLSALLAFAAQADAQAGQAGVTVVPLNPADPQPLVVLPKVDFTWDDIHFHLGTPPALDLTNTKLEDQNGADLGWGAPTAGTNAGDFDMSAGSNGTPVSHGDGAGLQLKSMTGAGWPNVKYSRSRKGKTLYPNAAMADAGSLTTYTGNAFPVQLGAVFLLTNSASRAISSLHFAVDTTQSFTEIGSDAVGEGLPSDGDFVFDSPLEVGDSTAMFWTYDAFSSTPANDTTVTITATFTGGLLSLASGTGTTRLTRLSSPAATLPTLVLREARVGGFGSEIRLSSSGAYRFVSAGQVVRTAGQTTAGTPYIASTGDLVIPLSGSSTTKCSWTLSGVAIDTSATPIGPVRMFLGTRPTSPSAIVGMRR